VLLIPKNIRRCLLTSKSLENVLFPRLFEVKRVKILRGYFGVGFGMSAKNLTEIGHSIPTYRRDILMSNTRFMISDAAPPTADIINPKYTEGPFNY
jgi:hypothetical protein